MDSTIPRVILSIVLAVSLPMVSPGQDRLAKENIPHSRQKRILSITNDGRLVLPPGTKFRLTTSLSVPFTRKPPTGISANINVDLPLEIDFDKLGLTDKENPFGDFSPFFARSMASSAASLMAEYIGRYLNRRRGKREERQAIPPEVENALLDKLHGGERALMYSAAEDMLSNFGMSGKECLLRVICEIHAHPLTNFGFFGEVMKLFLTPSKSPYAGLMQDYIEAQEAGQSGGECWPYYKFCPKSIFMPSTNRYTKDAEDLHRHQEYENVESNNIETNIKAM